MTQLTPVCSDGKTSYYLVEMNAELTSSLQNTVQYSKRKYCIKVSTRHTRNFVRASLFADPQMFLSKHIWLIKLYPKISNANRQECQLLTSAW